MILVFVGAGGSAAVDPKQYPTTVGFFERLPGEIKGDPLFGVVQRFLKSQKREGQPIDVEEVLWSLDKVQEYFSLSRNTNTIEGWVMANDLLGPLDGHMVSQRILSSMENITETYLTPLQNRINLLVHEFYAAVPDRNKLRHLYKVLRELKSRDSIIEIFTTNYDRVLEAAIRESGINIETGREYDGLDTRLNTTCWDKPGEPLDGHGRLTKLHGSVDWRIENEAIICGPARTRDLGDHLILYPGFKGKPDKEPFIKFHEHLREVVSVANAAVFIGFAFRDDYINEILSNLPPGIPKYVINKDDSLPELHFLEGCGHFNNGLTRQAVEGCINYLKLSARVSPPIVH